ncbi:hypothetical protein AB833_19480 [Chromatiales bacterium (ex Bugula neritina AB1)]|nr:hypothetical protein AB833_19480 [Chromatiales bacterium (ex Bugula neritina AB1)]
MSRDLIFQQAKIDWSKVIGRESPEVLVPEWGETEGQDAGPYKIFIKKPSGPTLFLIEKATLEQDMNRTYAGMIVACSYDFFGKPIFYDTVSEDGNPLSLDEQRKQMRESVDQLQLSCDPSVVKRVANEIGDILERINLTPDQVKEPSSQGSTPT